MPVDSRSDRWDILWAGIVKGTFGVRGDRPSPEGMNALRNAAQALEEMRATRGWEVLVDLIDKMERGLLRGLEPPEILHQAQYSQNLGIRDGLMRARELPEVVKAIAAEKDEAVKREVRRREERSRSTGGADGGGTGTGSSG